MKSAAFFHGLESPSYSEKNVELEKAFDEVYAPPMDYSDPRVFDQVLSEVKKRRPDVLIGSSMGGWFAYCISTLTGIPTLLFNPAVHSRSMEPRVKRGSQKAPHTVILGDSDSVIDPKKTVEWFSQQGVPIRTKSVSIGHRVPLDVFSKWIRSPELIRKVSESDQCIKSKSLANYESFLLLQESRLRDDKMNEF
jgi:hypothetical protein